MARALAYFSSRTQWIKLSLQWGSIEREAALVRADERRWTPSDSRFGLRITLVEIYNEAQ